MSADVTIHISVGADGATVSRGAGGQTTASEAPPPMAIEQLQASTAADPPSPISPDKLSMPGAAAGAAPPPMAIEQLLATMAAAPAPAPLGTLADVSTGAPAPLSLEHLQAAAVAASQSQREGAKGNAT